MNIHQPIKLSISVELLLCGYIYEFTHMGVNSSSNFIDTGGQNWPVNRSRIIYIASSLSCCAWH